MGKTTVLTIELDKERHLILDFNVVREWEQATQKNFWKISAETLTGSDSLALAWAMLRQEDETLTQHAVGKIIPSDMWVELDQKMSILLAGAEPEEKKGKDKKNKTPLATRS